MKIFDSGLFGRIRDNLTDDKKRTVIQYVCIYAIMIVVSGFMTIVNIFTQKYILMTATAIFAVVNIVNILLTRRGSRGMSAAALIFTIEVVCLFIFFIISGTPEGFSAIWICLIPTSGLLLFGRKRGSVLCAVILIIVIVLFQTEWGISLLQYNYTDSFRLRFPMLYIAFFAVSFFLETVRAMTNEKLRETQRQYKYLYCHDALTDLCNRYGFDEKLNETLNGASTEAVSMMMIDIDHFKDVNDTHGHKIGDIVLKRLAEILTETSGEQSVVCRWGGEEFTILPVGADGRALADAILKRVAETQIIAEDLAIGITVSIGGITVTGRDVSVSRLFIAADKNLYQAKITGRNRVVWEYADK